MKLTEYYKNNKKGTIVFLVILVLALISLAGNAGFSGSKIAGKKMSSGKSSGKSEKIASSLLNGFNQDEQYNKIPVGKKYVAEIYITGVITSKGDTYNQKWLLKTLKTIKEDKNNTGIILYIDSPGGGVYEADETYLALLDYKETTGRPVYSYFGPLSASGGYYIGCAADYVMANRNTLTGSIGVISGQFVDLTGLFEKWGISVTTIHSGKNKIMGSSSEKPTQEQIDIMQAISDECYEQFVGIVAKHRCLEYADVEKLADGRIYTASQAKENGLIDSIGSLEDLEKSMFRKEFDYKDYEIAKFAYKRDQTFRDVIFGKMPAALGKVLEPQVTYPAYLYSY